MSASTPTNASSSSISRCANPSIHRPQSPSSLPSEAIDLATKLFNLSRTGDTSTLLAYVSAGIPPNLTNSSGDTLLMLASYHGHVSTAKGLLDAGADPNILNDRGQAAVAAAMFKGWDAVVRVLVEGGADVLLGTPSAVDCARMFGREDVLGLVGAEGDAKGREVQMEARP